MKNKILRKAEVVLLHFKKMGFLNAILYIFQRIVRKKKHIVARVKNVDFKIYLRNDLYDTQVFTQIFLREELNFDIDGIPETIIDGGANIGLATLYLKNKYPNARVVAVEPESSNFELLLKNTKQLAGVTCVKKGIWNRNCNLEIIDNGDGNASFRTVEVENPTSGRSFIESVSIDHLMSEFNLRQLDLVKLDIEGSEMYVFKSNYEQWLAKSNNVVVEIHPYLHPDCERTVFEAFSKNFTVSTSGEYFLFKRHS